MSPAVFEVTIPQLGVNDETVLVVEWRVRPGARIERMQVIATVETTKAAFDLETEEAGFLYPIVEAGTRVPIRTVVALVTQTADTAAVDAYLASHPVAPSKQDSRQSELGDELILTAGARKLVEEHAIDTARLPKGRIIREQDVRVLLGGDVSIPKCDGDPLNNVAVYGAAQGGLVVAEALTLAGYHVAAFLDDAEPLAKSLLNDIPVIPGSQMPVLLANGIGAVATHIASPRFRMALRDRAASHGLTMMNTIHPKALVSPSAILGQGNLIKAGAIVDTEVRIGDCCIIDNGVVLPHHVRVGSGCHIAPGASMGGDCDIGEFTVVGVGARLAPRLKIGSKVIIGVGANVVRDVPDGAIVEGTAGRVAGHRLA